MGEARNATSVTFADNIASIVHSHCTSCHRQGQSGPFELITYDDVVKNSKTIQQVVNQRYMPPWKPDPNGIHYLNDRRLSSQQIEQINAWVEGGCVEGDRKKTPKPPTYPDGWSLGKPDLVLTMDESFTVPADGPDLYRSFVFKAGLDEDRWIKAIELRPTARAAVHHALFFVDSSGRVKDIREKDGKPGVKGMNFFRGIGASGNGFSRMADGLARGLGGYVPGATPNRLPGDLARFLPRGSDIIMQTHFHPTGKVEHEKAELGIYFADVPPKQRLVPIQMPALFGVGAGIDIPAGEKEFTIEETMTLPISVKAFEIGGHAHYICKRMVLEATLPDSSKQTLLKIDDWDLDWQDQYLFSKEIELPKGTSLRVSITYDNSADNPENPYSPPRRITWGRESNDEMGAITMTVIAANEEERPILEEAVRKRSIQAIRNRIQNQSQSSSGLGERLGGLRGRLGNGAMLKLLDRNQDGALDSDEIPEGIRDRLLDFLDEDGNDRLDARELEAGRRNMEEIMKDSDEKAQPKEESKESGDRAKRIRDALRRKTGEYRSLEYRDLDGKKGGVPSLRSEEAMVVVFASATCPIANSYQPELRRLAEAYQTRNVSWVLMHADAKLEPSVALMHRDDFQISFAVAIDEKSVWSKSLQAEVMPEAFLINGNGDLLYRGRIDDRYPELGKKRPEAQERDLQRALEEWSQGLPISVPRTKAIGCKISGA